MSTAPLVPAGTILAARSLVKTYGSVEAMRGADFDLKQGEILAVVGDNGAGKSTLIKSLAGATVPDSGQIFIDGKPVQISDPTQILGAGIGVVHQDLALSGELDLVSNLFLGREIRKPSFSGRVLRTLDRAAMAKIAGEQLASLGLGNVSLTTPVRKLSGGQRQAVAIARGMAFGARVLVLDEPTAALGVRETAVVIDLIRRVRDKGVSVTLISHNLPQVLEIADRIHIHRQGRRAAVVRPAETSLRGVVGIMTGIDEIAA
ncbi:ATP-binding cassette domain-containing protein [Kaistia sp. K-TC2]|uniref:ATP-binding cassette domain-containing protein n=2 Tax=Kaistia nematophila TaxID=2994654 RepID=A0A9X3E6B2_9HYPH|nr:ATP-binding cassette domain-containing protein [Kaistia nematophila]MCX5570343.1 ATP-binding cassette domain-containing protein [Kaistia nematophila]